LLVFSSVPALARHQPSMTAGFVTFPYSDLVRARGPGVSIYGRQPPIDGRLLTGQDCHTIRGRIILPESSSSSLFAKQGA
jgi:hypothetical protein